ncbi:MAG TPA: helix-turn-helix transcriptional regulator [Methylophilus sp.]|nr:helix-turn-helix transcriptional regulator [Methylophilus sp.]
MSTFETKSISTFPERLLIERKRMGLSQEEFGKLGNISKTAQYLYESARNWPTLEYLEALRMRGVDVTYIASGVRSTQQTVDWPILKNAFLLVHHSLAKNQEVSFTPEQLFEAFKAVVEGAAGTTRADLLTKHKDEKPTHV